MPVLPKPVLSRHMRWIYDTELMPRMELTLKNINTFELVVRQVWAGDLRKAA